MLRQPTIRATQPLARGVLSSPRSATMLFRSLRTSATSTPLRSSTTNHKSTNATTRPYAALPTASSSVLLSLANRPNFPIARFVHPSPACPKDKATLSAIKDKVSGVKDDVKGKAEEAINATNKDFQNVTATAREELQGVTRSFAEMIAGGSVQAAAALGARENVHAGDSITGDFTAITSNLAKTVPKHVLYFGMAGTIPYLTTAIGTVFFAREASLAQAGANTFTGLDYSTAASYLHSLEHVQITYGAIILSFLGAIHWGFEFSKYGGEIGYQRLIIGTLPLLVAWPTTFLTHGLAIVAQWFAFTGTWVLDQRATTLGWTPNWYATYRFYLSIIVGFSIIGTLAGESYYGEGSGAAAQLATAKLTAMERREKLAAQKAKEYDPYASGKQIGIVHGDIMTEDLDAEGKGEAYVLLKHVDEKDEADESQEDASKQETAEKQDAKDAKQAASAPDGMKTETKNRADST